MRLQPDFTIAGWLDFIRIAPDDAANLREGLPLAGLPDQAPTPQRSAINVRRIGMGSACHSEPE
jgi:hypothetical protein